LIMNRFSQIPTAGGFRLDSPVKVPVASEMLRSAPPYTSRAREEPCQGGLGCSDRPVLDIRITRKVTFPLPQTRPSRRAKHFVAIEYSSAGKHGFYVAPKLHRPIFPQVLEDHAAWEAQAGHSTDS
jgi:hypothetical protein